MRVSATKISVYTLTALFLILGAGSFVVGATTSTPNPQLNQDIKKLDASIRDKRAQLNAIKKQQALYQAQLSAIQEKSATLANQLEAVDTHVAQTQLELDQARVDIETVNLEIQKVTLEITEQDKKIDSSKDSLTTALKLLSQEDGRSQLEIILMNDYLTDYVNQLKYLENINDKISDTLGGLRIAKDNLTQSRGDLDANRERLRKLRNELEQKKAAFAEEKDAKTYLLSETKLSESEYQKLLTKSRREQDNASSDIVTAEKRLREKLREKGADKTIVPSTGFIWPVPKSTITAYFHDPSYPFKKIFEHPAIDLRAPQGTPIHASASGYVSRARDAGMGYNYISIIHPDGISTVYGHVSKIYVSQDEYVTQGQIIGLSGAMPGTPGAGPFTTGPHLHLEFRRDGVPVDPLGFLP